MILCGEYINARTASRTGLIEQRVETGEARGHALLLANRAAQQNPVAVRLGKCLIQGARQQAPNTWLTQELEYFMDLFNKIEGREGICAFLEKRTPR